MHCVILEAIIVYNCNLIIKRVSLKSCLLLNFNPRSNRILGSGSIKRLNNTLVFYTLILNYNSSTSISSEVLY